MKSKKKILVYLNFITGIIAFLAIILACINYQSDGYSFWYKRLLYFTIQSNLWIGVMSIVFAILYYLDIKKNKQYITKTLYIIKFACSIAITITGFIFCSLLAPFADYNVWTFHNILTHIATPVCAIACFFMDENQVKFKKNNIFYSLTLPGGYFLIVIILQLSKVDFGKSDYFPYFFMDFNSQVGWFGYNFSGLPQLGTFYWLVIMSLIIISISYVYYLIHKKIHKEN